MSSLDPDPIETLHPNERDQREVIDELRKCTVGSKKGPARPMRIAFSAPSMSVSITNPGGNTVTYSVIPRDLSRRGVSFLHGRFIYPDSKCQIVLPALDGECITIEGTIVRCRHLSGTIHEVAAVIDPPIDLSLFTQMTRSEQIAHEDEYLSDVDDGKIERAPRKLGEVLLIDSCPLDLKLYSTLLNRIGLRCREFSNATEAMQTVDFSKIDAVVVDVCREPTYGFQTITNIREGGFSGPVMAVSAEEDDQTREAAIGAGANVFIPKPLKDKVIEEQLGKLLRLELLDVVASDPIISTFNQDELIRPLLREFVNNARELIGTLNSANDVRDLDHLRQICRQLKGAGGGYGFEEVSEKARSVLDAINADNTDDAQAVRESVDGLLDVLSRLRAA